MKHIMLVWWYNVVIYSGTLLIAVVCVHLSHLGVYSLSAIIFFPFPTPGLLTYYGALFTQCNAENIQRVTSAAIFELAVLATIQLFLYGLEEGAWDY